MFHPNDHGYRVWADAFAPSLAAQLVERFTTPDAAAHRVASRSTTIAAPVGHAAAGPPDVGGDA